MSSAKRRLFCLGFNVSLAEGTLRQSCLTFRQITMTITFTSLCWYATMCCQFCIYLVIIIIIVMICLETILCGHSVTHWPQNKNGDILHGTFPDIFIDKIICISNKISLACVPVALIDNKPVSVPVVARQRAGEKPQTEPMMTTYVLSDCWMLINP